MIRAAFFILSRGWTQINADQKKAWSVRKDFWAIRICESYLRASAARTELV